MPGLSAGRRRFKEHIMSRLNPLQSRFRPIPAVTDEILHLSATYGRLDVNVHESWRVLVRQAALKLKSAYRRDPTNRSERKRFYRAMLAFHAQAQDVVRTWRL